MGGLKEPSIQSRILCERSGSLSQAADVALRPRAHFHAATDQLTARVIASTESDLAALAQSGSFDRELHAALSVVTVKLPPLRERFPGSTHRT